MDYFKGILGIGFLLLSTLSLAQGDAIVPLPTPTDTNPNKIRLGYELFHDSLFSKDQSLSCASCHVIRKGGSDNLNKYVGLNRIRGNIHTPTVLNASLNFRQFWDGRAKTLTDAIEDHLKNKTIFDNNWATVVDRIAKNDHYTSLFRKIYDHKVSAPDVQDALVSYLEYLITTKSPFDRFLQGDKNALNADEKKGYRYFREYGCILCHQGTNVGGNLYQKMGIYKDYFANRQVSTADLGLYNITGAEEDKFVFKVPSLRNVALRAPYLHDGSARTLAQAIEIMGEYQVGQPIPPEDITYIVKFLQTLTGQVPAVAEKYDD